MTALLRLIKGRTSNGGLCLGPETRRGAGESPGNLWKEISEIVHKLEGPLTPEGFPEDGRASVISAKERILRVHKKLRAQADEIFREHLANWSARDLSLLAELLERLASDLRESPASCRGLAARAAPE